jgi:enoyl-[acyl-carrier protein] reductase II
MVKNRVTEILGTEYPLIQGGMANIGTGEFAAAVSNAGALGLIASGGMDTEELKRNIEICRRLTDKPFGVNIMLMNPEADRMARLVIEEGVKVVTTGAGNPAKFMADWKAAGIKVIPVVPSVALGVRLERIGADALIVEGTEAGGHIGELTTMALVPQVVDAVKIPVIAAGGIADSRQLVAAFALGAQGVQVGTCLLVSEECPIHENYKKAVLEARDTDTTVTGRIAGVPVRILKNKMAREYIRREKEGADRQELEKYTLGSLRRAVLYGDVKNGSLMAGQVAGMCNHVRPVAEIIRSLFSNSGDVLERLEKEFNRTAER